MRVSREQAAANRRRIVKVAGRLFREKGFDGIGVADLMRSAGLTHGGFYGHFQSKGDLAAEACTAALATTVEKWQALVDAMPDQPLRAVAQSYLSARHRDNPGGGCPFPTLGADVARQHGVLRRSFTDGLEALVGFLTRIVPGRSAAARRERALATMAGFVGAIVLARTVDDPALSDEILAAAAATFGGGRTPQAGRAERSAG